ncbi:MAG: hypothetical protein ACRD1D_03765 [Acidimicrobiales bacterium]
MLVALVAMVAGACGGDDEDEPAPPRQTAPAGVYFGAVGMATDRVAVAVDPPDGGGRQRVRAFVVDGEPNGDAEWFDGAAEGLNLRLTSASGRARMNATIEPAQVHGTVTLADGRERHFHTIPATHGAGIYDVTVSADGRYNGTATDGSRLEGRQVGTFVEGVLVTPSGERHSYRVADLSRAYDYQLTGGAPDRYTLIVSRYGLAQLGRGGDGVKTGAPGPNIIALDLGASSITSPGLYYGKVAMGTDQFAMQVDEPSGGSRRVRVYLSDGEPEPEGDIEWFTGTVGGNNRFELTSASRNARMQGEIAADSVQGTVTLPDQPARPFFAVPAGDGAGIYEVTVTPDKKYTGTAEDGTRLELSQEGDVVQGTFFLQDGRRIGLLAYDLTRVYAYGVEGSKPDTFLAFASPGGRYLIGRSGDVRGGTAGNNIIGLDKAC